MRQLVRHVSRAAVSNLKKSTANTALPPRKLHFAGVASLGNAQCLFSTTTAAKPCWTNFVHAIGVPRHFSSAAIRAKEDEHKEPITGPKPEQPELGTRIPTRRGASSAEADQAAEPTLSPQRPIQPPQVPLNGSSVRPAQEENLPSAKEARRWRLSKWFNKVMDDLMPKFAMASQRINSYTGTDYSGIEGLRREIKDQEQLVKARHAAVETAKSVLDEAHAKASASQKEVVGLLERKHSWSAADLERYMALIRSEHVNDQAVQAAKDSVAAAERALEEARTRLEKRERAQYHEEQIWSDTIRRNSTWVTFGLMGVNILLLLANVVLIEPWRRRRMVREIKATLEERAAAAAPVVVSAAAQAAVVEEDIDAVVEPAGFTSEQLESGAEALSAAWPSENVMLAEAGPAKGEGSPSVQESKNWTWAGIKANAQRSFSEQAVSMRMVDVTAIALGAAATGAVLSALIAMVIRSR